MHARAALAALAPLPLLALLSGAPRATELRFAPAEGLALRKSFESRVEQEVGAASLTVDGEQQETPDSSQSTTIETRLVLVDRYLACEGGRATRLERLHEEFESGSETAVDFGGESHEISRAATCELVGHAVVFAWDEEDEEYAASSEDEEVEAEWLEDLRAELDFLALLPPGEVDLGDEWEVDVEALRAMLRFERGLPLEWTVTVDGEERDAPEDPGEDEAPEETISGEVTARLEAVRDEDGRALAVIALQGEYEVTTSDERTVEGEHGTQTTALEVTVTVALEGECLWDADAGHFAACELRADSTTVNRAEMSGEMMGREMTIEQESTLEAELVFRVRFEPAE